MIKFFLSKNFPQFLPIIIFFSSLFGAEVLRSETNAPLLVKDKAITASYLNSKKELEDYILDTGDSLSIEFFPAEELNGIFPINEEGEIFLPRLDEIFVRGLTKSELKTLLEKRYSEFLIDPEIKVRIAVFKSIRVTAKGELRNPGFYNFPAYRSASFINLDIPDNFNLDIPEYSGLDSNNKQLKELGPSVKRLSENITTISDVIRQAGGITSKTDLSRIQITRVVPLGEGGGKKRAIIDFSAFVNNSDLTNDIRIFDGDSLFFPKLSESNPSQISKSILSGISPRFISVNISGKIENPGIIKLPLEATLSDALDISGPRKPLSGKVVLIRYQNDGTLLKKNIAYRSGEKRGSEKNPFLKADDLISVKNSFYGKTAGFIKEVTAPFTGIYSTKKLIDEF